MSKKILILSSMLLAFLSQEFVVASEQTSECCCFKCLKSLFHKNENTLAQYNPDLEPLIPIRIKGNIREYDMVIMNRDSSLSFFSINDDSNDNDLYFSASKTQEDTMTESLSQTSTQQSNSFEEHNSEDSTDIQSSVRDEFHTTSLNQPLGPIVEVDQEEADKPKSES